jgi:2,4-dienoyl-CoA reductase-like NADH-dependent reductase (Old Yellow Enzyme family)
MSDALAPLFEPFDAAGLTLKNRIVMSPMTRWKSPAQYPGPDVAAYYRRRAENDVGLIITEGTTVDHPVSSYSMRTPAFHGNSLEGWRRVLDEVHGAGGRIVPQLWHVGIMRDPRADEYPNRDSPSVSPSGVFKPGGKQVFPPMTTTQIQEVIDSFARAATSARELGFDGVEIHGAHGYLVDQFLWEDLNRRDDEYGDNAVQRTRFAVQLITAVRAAVGRGFPVILRISQWKQQQYSARLAETPELLQRIFQPIADAGVDIFHCSQRRYWDVEFAGSPLNLAGWITQLTGRPTITVGSVGLAGPLSVTELGERTDACENLAPLAQRVAHREFDLVAVGRALLVDPAWARKIKENRFSELLPFTQDCLETLS